MDITNRILARVALACVSTSLIIASVAGVLTIATYYDEYMRDVERQFLQELDFNDFIQYHRIYPQGDIIAGSPESFFITQRIVKRKIDEIYWNDILFCNMNGTWTRMVEYDSRSVNVMVGELNGPWVYDRAIPVTASGKYCRIHSRMVLQVGMGVTKHGSFISEEFKVL